MMEVHVYSYQKYPKIYIKYKNRYYPFCEGNLSDKHVFKCIETILTSRGVLVSEKSLPNGTQYLRSFSI